MKVNDEVKINPDNVPDYFDFESNPTHLTGKIVAIHDKDEFDDYNIDVEFSNGVLNAYDKEHLIFLEK